MLIDLDDVGALRSKDTADALGDTGAYADQFRQGRTLADGLPATLGEPPREVMVLGTGGGSAAATKLVSAAVFRRCRVPLLLDQAYEVPAFVTRDTFVIAVSHSGTTEEIVAAYEQALGRGCRSVVLTSGGPLSEIAERARAPVVAVPGGKMPRIVLGLLIMPLLGVLQRLTLIEIGDAELEDLFEVLAAGPSQFGVEVPTASNPAKQLAQKLADKTPVLYGLNPSTSAAADRWKRQFGENSKVMAFANSFPDAHHDEAVGWDQRQEALERFGFIVLSDDEADERLLKRVRATQEVLRQRGASIDVVGASGRSPLGRLLSLVQLGDYVSIYLALRRGIDPTPVALIDHFKSVLAQA